MPSNLIQSMTTLAFMLTHPAVEDIGINVMAYGQRSQRYATSQILRHQFCFELRTVTAAPANLLGIVLCHYKHRLIISWVLSLAYFDGSEKMPSPDAYDHWVERGFKPQRNCRLYYAFGALRGLPARFECVASRPAGFC